MDIKSLVNSTADIVTTTSNTIVEAMGAYNSIRNRGESPTNVENVAEKIEEEKAVQKENYTAKYILYSVVVLVGGVVIYKLLKK